MEKAQRVLRYIENLAIRDELPIIGREKANIIKEFFGRQKPTSVLEIGTLFGYSAISMALASEDVKITTIEIDSKNAETAKQNIKDAGLEDRIKILTGAAEEIIPTIEEKFDILFIDGKNADYLLYLKEAEKNLNPGSVVIADNTGKFPEKMKNFLDYVRNSGKYSSHTIKTKNDEMEFSTLVE